MIRIQFFLFKINCKVLYMFIINNNNWVVKFKKYLFFFHDDVGLSCVWTRKLGLSSSLCSSFNVYLGDGLRAGRKPISSSFGFGGALILN